MENEKTNIREEYLEARDLAYVMQAHSQMPTKPSKAFRKGDGKTPSGVHPLWCASTILTELSLDSRVRAVGAKTLLYHDVKEDTTAGLPAWLETEVVRNIEDMTFYGGMKEEMQRIWEKPTHIKLFKLYDKVSNLLDGAWMDSEKRVKYLEYTAKLKEIVEQNYGRLNIVKIAEGIK